jgi:hypothetical protein
MHQAVKRLPNIGRLPFLFCSCCFVLQYIAVFGEAAGDEKCNEVILQS